MNFRLLFSSASKRSYLSPTESLNPPSAIKTLTPFSRKIVTRLYNNIVSMSVYGFDALIIKFSGSRAAKAKTMCVHKSGLIFSGTYLP